MADHPRIAEPVPLPRCLGPGCIRVITHRAPSPWFCGELCSRTFQLHALRKMTRLASGSHA